MANLPETQCAVQLVGPDELVLNKSKSRSLDNRDYVLGISWASGKK